MNIQQSYEETLYPDLAFGQTHPDRLATLARLLGLNPAPVTACRVLELGSASGGNLIPMAYALPHSQFVGVDFGEKQVVRGHQKIAALGLQNIDLHHMNILDVGRQFGQFDYIIAHGIYSWVPTEVRLKLFEICQQNLAPQGVAYISYNAYPGWHMLGIIRDLMLFHTRHLTDPQEKADAAKEALSFLRHSIPYKDTTYARFLMPYADFLQEQLDRVGKKADEFLLHDELELVNDAVLFHQFADQAAEYGLQYLTEAEFHSVMPHHFAPEAMARIQQLATNIIEMEQYMDFARNRVFRQTLLCRAELTIQRTLNAPRVEPFYIGSRAKIVSESPNLYTPSIEEFESYDGSKLTIEHPVSKVALVELIQQWPALLPFDELVQVARQRVQAHGGILHELAADREILAINLLKAYTYSLNLVEFHSYHPPFVLEVAERPVASAIARYQAQQQTKVTNLYQEGVNLDGLNAYLIRHLNGQHDRQELLTMLKQLVQDGTLTLKQELSSEAEQMAFLETQLEKQLHWLARAALLVEGRQ